MAQQTAVNPQIVNFAPQFLVGTAQNMMEHVTRVHTKSLKTSFELQKETFDFMQNRYRKDMAFANNLMSIRHPVEAMSAYTGFVQDTLDDYANEAVKLGNYGAEILALTNEDTEEMVLQTQEM